MLTASTHHEIITPAKKVDLKMLKEHFPSIQMISKNRYGHVIFRRAFFYRHNGSAEKLKLFIEHELVFLNLQFQVIDSGEVWKPFKGSASVSKQSHWFVEVKFI